MDDLLIDLIDAIAEFEGDLADFHPEFCVLDNKEHLFELH